MPPTESDIVKELLVEQFTTNIEAWRPTFLKRGGADIFRKDRAELSKVRTMFKRGKYAEFLEAAGGLDTIVRSKVPEFMRTYAELVIRATQRKEHQNDTTN